MKFDVNNMQNFDINKSMKILIFLSFVIQWSFLSMIINLFTMGIVSFPLFILLILDALTMIKIENKTIKRPSFILSLIWDMIDYISNRRSPSINNTNTNTSVVNTFDRLSINLRNTINKIKNMLNNLRSEKLSRNKYNKERQLNKFSDEIGKKVIIEYTSQDQKLKKKTFDYKDRASTFINILESKGYKNYTKYNLDINSSLTYLVYNKNKDIIDISANKIQVKKDEKTYKYVTDGWPL